MISLLTILIIIIGIRDRKGKICFMGYKGEKREEKLMVFNFALF